MIKIECEKVPWWAEGLLENHERRYRLILDGVVVREHLSFDEAIEAVCQKEESETWPK